jgi:hypothetical protein
MTVPTLETLSRPVEAASTMTRRWPWIVVTLVYCVVIPSPSSGATSGHEWRGLSDFNRALYVAGVLDGWQAVRVTLPPGPSVINSISSANCPRVRWATV